MDGGSGGISVTEGIENAVEEAGDCFIGCGDDVETGGEDDSGGCKAILDCWDGDFGGFYSGRLLVCRKKHRMDTGRVNEHILCII